MTSSGSFSAGSRGLRFYTSLPERFCCSFIYLYAENQGELTRTLCLVPLKIGITFQVVLFGLTFRKLSFMQKFPFLFTIVTLIACGADNASTESAVAEQVDLVCENQGEVGDVPTAAVYFLAGDSKVKIAAVTVCEEIESEQYEEFGIPAEALAAVGGWYAGAGDYLYAVQEEEAVTVYQGGQDEMQEEPGFGYAPIARYVDGEVELLLQ